MEKIEIPREVLYQKYIIEEKSCREIAKEFNCHLTCIWWRLKKLNIPVRNLSESHKGIKNLKSSETKKRLL